MKAIHHFQTDLQVALTRYTNNRYQPGTFIAVVLIVLLFGGQPASAEVLVNVSTSVASSTFNERVLDDSFAELGPVEIMGSGEFGFGHARASGLDASALLQVSASTVIPAADSASMTARASWHDIVFVSGPSVPDSIRLNFVVDGQLAVSELNGGGFTTPDISQAALFILALGRHTGFDPPLSRGFGPVAADGFKIEVQSTNNGTGTVHTAEAVSGGGQQWFSQDLTTADQLNYDFHGTFGIVADRNDLGGGTNAYFAALGIAASSANRDGNSSSDFFGTIGLTSVTNEDGSPLSGDLTVVFDSGLVIPEPGTAMILIPFGILAIGRVTRR